MRNAFFLPGVALPDNIAATGEMAAGRAANAVARGRRPSICAGALFRRARAPYARAQRRSFFAPRESSAASGKLLTEVLRECAPGAEPAILSGPVLSPRDVARHLPTAVTIAAKMDVALRLQATLGHATFRPYASDDLIGVALGGAAKNVYAIACGIVAGMGLGESARAALLARSFAELCRLGEKLGAKSETLMGLSGLGDLVLTATSPTSRNYSFGLALGKGSPRDELLRAGQPLAEGVETASALVARAGARHRASRRRGGRRYSFGQLALGRSLPRLMARPLKTE
jgi:glycerol-3-phosphate dehydrogenase (NAD(P)+)